MWELKPKHIQFTIRMMLLGAGLAVSSSINVLGASQVALVVENPPANAGDIRDMGLIPGLGRSPGGEHGNPLCTLAKKIPWTEEPGAGYCPWGRRVGHD